MHSPKIVLGLWPIAGITTIGVTDQDARATLRAAIDAGITTFDTAYSYGYDGESDRLLGEFVRDDRDRFTVMGKVGQRWTEDRKRIVDGSPRQLTSDAEESLRRMGIDAMDTLFLHSPDPNVPLEESAGAMQRLQARGLCKRIGICNATAEQIDQFAGHVATDAIQCPLNLVQRENQSTLIQPAMAAGREVYVFWTLMKGLLAGKITRDHVFPEGDSRPGYAIFQGETRRRIHDAIDRLSELGRQVDQSVAQLSIGWAISQPGVTAALVGARREEQIRELAGARVMPPETLAAVEQIVEA
ncbi:aldo/keto reductase [Rhodopirellula sp. JC639]|uniref:aldo/keto reductase n=1 Tax=Stieleria mannarensis TaxID=2755585 RepID=UPI0015FFEB70|nr:aldo/keto reductase [Rhodopirellula sp. JC639]